MSVLRWSLAVIAVLVLLMAGTVAWFAQSTRGQIDALERTLAARAAQTPAFAEVPADLPAPVRRYFDFVFPDGPPGDVTHVEIEMAGQFRRPQTEDFQPTTARQVVGTRAPDMVFSADTPIVWPLWAIAWDAYIDGDMEMRARLLSMITVMAEDSTPALNRTSLRRWLLESPTYPMALLPGGPVTWEPVDDTRARAVVRAHGEEASLVATFGPDGALTRFDAEQDGDLTTPYHGSGEHVRRTDYTLVDGVRVPMGFEIARAAGGQIYPFWTGRVTQIRFLSGEAG